MTTEDMASTPPIYPGLRKFADKHADRDGWATVVHDLRTAMDEVERLRADDCSRFTFVHALAKETFSDKYGPSAWGSADDPLRRQWIARTQDAVQRARHAITSEQPQ